VKYLINMEEEKKEPPDVIDSGKTFSSLTKEEMTKEKAQRMYNQLIDDDSLMHELNVLLRKYKLEQLKDK